MSSMGDNRSESRNSDMVPGDLSEVDDMDRREEEPQETRRLLSPIPVGEKATQNQNDESQRPQGRRASVDQSPRESPPEVNIRGMKSRGSMESMPVREDSNKYDEVALGENQGEVIPEEEKKRMMTESLQRCLRAGDKKENIGTLAYDNVLKLVTEADYFRNKGKIVFTRAFFDMLAHVIAFEQDHEFAKDCIPWIALRHVQYQVPLDKMPALRQALLQALESLSGEMWSVAYENVWGQTFDKAANLLVKETTTMFERLRVINEDWLVVTDQLGKEALAAKISANLTVISLQRSPSSTKRMAAKSPKGGLAAKSPKGGQGGGGMGKGQGALADDLCALLTWLVEAVQDISKLRGVVDCLGVPFDHLFKSYGQVPDLVKVSEVVFSTMKEVVGADWDPSHEEAWEWLWGLVVSERTNKWTTTDRERVFQGWQSVEAAVLRARSAQQAGEANPAEFFLSEEMKAKAQHMEKPEGQEEKAEAENADNAPPGIDLLSAEDDEPNKCWSWLCGKKKKRPTGAESVLSTGSLTKKEQKKALALKLQSAYVPPKEVTAAVLDEFWNEVSEAPTIGQVFMKHKDLYYEVIHAVIARMVAYIDSPWSIWTDDPELALRHVIFGVTPADLRLFCRIYLQSLQKIAREEWLPQYQHAWTKFFNIAAAGLAQFIVAGLDPVTRSLITGSLSDLQGALMGKARGLRAKCCCEVMIKGERRAPVDWMIEQGRQTLAGLLIKDCFALRVNKSGVYCGREMFWAVYGKHIVPLLCTEAPDLLQVFLDGHIWTSDLVIEGTRKTVLYVKELWGDLSAQIPETELSTEKGNLYDRPSDFPLSHLVLLGRGRIADHPVISWIVETKWKVFARGVFVLRQSLFAGIALFSSFGYVWLARGNAYVSFAFRCAALACSLLVLYLEVNTCLRQMENGFVKGRLPYHMTLAWTWAGWTVIVMNFAAFSEELAYGGLDYLLANKPVVEHFDNPGTNRITIVGGINLLISWLMTINLLALSKNIMCLVVLLKHLGVRLLSFGLFIGFITIAFASALRIVSGRMIKHFDGTEASVLSTIGLLVGSYRVDFETEVNYFITRFFVLSYMTIASLVLAKFLLVLYTDAVMTKVNPTSESRWVEENVVEEVALSRAIIVADIENSFTRGRLHRLNEKYMKDVFEEKLYFNNELEISPQGGVTVEMPPAFKSPSLEVDGHNDRRQIYDSEEGPEVPWPKETANEKELAGDSDGANSDASREMKMVCDSISSVEKAMKSLSTLMAKISRTLKSSGLQEHGDGTSMGASNTVGTNGDAPSTFAGTKMRKKSKETDNQTDRKMQPHLPQSRRVSS